MTILFLAFDGASAFNSDLSGWDTSKVINLELCTWHRKTKKRNLMTNKAGREKKAAAADAAKANNKKDSL